jgi:beta-mannanase
MRTALRAAVPALLALGLLMSSASVEAGSRKIALGMSMDPMTKDTSWAAVQSVKTNTGRYPALWSVWSTWGTRGAAARFPTKTDPAFMNNLKTNHIVPMIVWQPSNPAVQPDAAKDPARLKNVIAGKYDAYIKQWAKDAKAYGSTVILRFAQEMNGSWNPWGVGYYDNDGTTYINAWKHVWTLFHTAGATNVKFLWSPYQPCGTAIGCVPYSSVFPGDKYVSYIGYSSFNWATPPSEGKPKRPWSNMVTVMKTGYKKLVALSNKPIIVAELASNRKGGDQAQWISNGYPAAFLAYPHITAIVYFDINMTDPNDVSQPNWVLTTDAWAAYKKIGSQKHFRGVIS